MSPLVFGDLSWLELHAKRVIHSASGFTTGGAGCAGS
jgi:hypothetical protein